MAINVSWTETHETAIEFDALLALFREHAPDVLTDAMATALQDEAPHDIPKYAPILAAISDQAGGRIETMTDINDVTAESDD